MEKEENKKSLSIELEIDGETKRYVTPNKLSGKLFRIGGAIADDIDTNNTDLSDLDSYLQFVCDVFGNQFDIDTLEEGTDPRDIQKTIYACTVFVTGQVSIASQMLTTDVDLANLSEEDKKKLWEIQ